MIPNARTDADVVAFLRSADGSSRKTGTYVHMA
jgi:hypothetical protein